MKHPVMEELIFFQNTLGRRDKIYWPTRIKPYYGKLEENSIGRSRYHEGLLISRALASHELVLLMYMVEKLNQDRSGIPLSLEHDGLLYLTRASTRAATLSSIDSFLKARSHELLGVSIPIELKL